MKFFASNGVAVPDDLEKEVDVALLDGRPRFVDHLGLGLAN